MNEFQPIYPDIAELDPYKRVRYTEGMVLGMDEFLQEELYLLTKHRRHNRGLHGYGTVCGLSVGARPRDDDTQIRVAPGIAVDPQGHEIRVPVAQCASVNTWLHNHREEIDESLGSPPGSPSLLTVYLLLCRRECESDYVPIPAGPCLSLDRTQAPTRIADDYDLILALEAPRHVEEHAVRALMDLLGHIEIRDTAGGLTPENIVCLVRNLLSDDSPLVCDPPLNSMHMRPSEAEAFVRIALRTWVTEVRPILLESGRNCVNGPPDESCVLLARIDMEVDDTAAGLRVRNGTVTIDDRERPFMVHSRLLQEHLILRLAGVQPGGEVGAGGASPAGSDDANLMHLTGDETVEGVKTFADPIALSASGRVQRRIMLPPAAGVAVNRQVRQTLFRSRTPAMLFALNGEASFTLQIPDDIEYGVVPSVRVVWGVTNDLDTLSFTWRVRNRYGEVDALFGPFTGTGGVLSGRSSRVRTGHVHVTEFVELPDSVTPADVYGGLRITLSEIDPADQQIFLLQTEVAYVADRLGRELP
ncbi:MAG: hypothetical protein GF344_12490 [Chitinivibrionales bacterium]|nr:hypothetical protein [Chitinivibrionales bacterium]MBD3357574.1 hypothetical protein [Chitinivibrionales bacterium]